MTKVYTKFWKKIVPQREVSIWQSTFPPLFGGGGIALILIFILNPFHAVPIRSFVEVEPTEISFGELSVFNRGQATVQLTNRGLEPVQYLVDLECACTFASPSTGTIESGKSVPIQLSYKPKGYSNSGSRIVESTSLQFHLRTSGNSDSVRLDASAKVLKPFSVDPTELQIDLRSFGETPFQIHLSLNEDVKGVAIASQTEEVGKLSVSDFDSIFRVATINGKLPQSDSQSTSLILEVTFDDAAKRIVELPLELTRLEPAQCSDLFVELAKGETQTVCFRPSNGTERVKITNVTCSAKELTFSIDGNSLDVSASESFVDQSCYFRVTLNCEATGFEDRVWFRDIMVHSATEFDLQTK